MLRHFTTAGSERDASGAVRLDLGEVATSAPLGAGGALAFGNDTLYAADGAVLVRMELGPNGWHETARSASLEHAIQQLEVVASRLVIVLDVGATQRNVCCMPPGPPPVSCSVKPLRYLRVTHHPYSFFMPNGVKLPIAPETTGWSTMPTRSTS